MRIIAVMPDAYKKIAKLSKAFSYLEKPPSHFVSTYLSYSDSNLNTCYYREYFVVKIFFEPLRNSVF